MDVTTAPLFGTERVVSCRPETASDSRHVPPVAAAGWSPGHPVLTIEGRRLLQDRADKLRTDVLPALRIAVNDADCDGHTEVVYGSALGELRQLEEALAEADGISTRKEAPSLVELGDRVTVEFLVTGPQPSSENVRGAGSVESFLLVHPVERRLHNRGLSAASPLGQAVLGRTIGNVVQVAAPVVSYPVRILAAKRPRGSRTKLARQRSAPPDLHDARS